MNSKNLFIFIQARLNSKRYPKKIIKKIKNKTFIEIMMSRLKELNKKYQIIFLIPNDKKNDSLNFFLKKKGYKVERGSNNNVLSRFYSAAKKNNAENIMRLTSDCPLIDYKICEKLIKIFFKKKLNYAYVGRSYADGLDCEIFDFRSLQKIYKIKNLKRNDKEHVSLYFRKNKKKFKYFQLKNKKDDSKVRITLDYPSDFEVIKSVINNFREILKGRYVSYRNIVKFIKKNNVVKKANLQKV
tara:strand:- start:6747 stop:7472 length:726 start_codon:yes stop_codon:yes gene_type:complete